jgi:hypothetical protein
MANMMMSNISVLLAASIAPIATSVALARYGMVAHHGVDPDQDPDRRDLFGL